MKLAVKSFKDAWHQCVAKALTFHKMSVCAALVTFAMFAHVQNITTVRRLSLYLGPGQCKWQPPTYDVPEDIKFTKTLIAGYPSGDKRLAFVQMEALTGLSARDEWDFAFLVSLIILYDSDQRNPYSLF
jgi:hypothetical protein